MRNTISLIFAAGFITSGFAQAAPVERAGTVHVEGRHDGGGHAGGGDIGRGGGTRVHFRGGGGRVVPRVQLYVPSYAGDPGLDYYGAYDDSGAYDAGTYDTGGYDSDAAPADAPVQPVLYYCDNPQGYYPDVTACNDDWQQVEAPPAQ